MILLIGLLSPDHSVFRFPLFLPNDFLSWDATLPWVVMCLLALLGWDGFSDFACFDDIVGFGTTGQIFCRRSLLGFAWCFSSHDWVGVMDHQEEEHGGEVSFSLHHIKDRDYQHGLALLMLTVITWLRSCLLVFSCLFFSSPPPPPYCPLWKVRHSVSLHLRNGELWFSSLKVECLH